MKRKAKPKSFIRPFRVWFLTFCIFNVISIFFLSCNKESDDIVDRIVIHADASEIKEHHTLQLSASVYLKSGKQVTNLTIIWASSNSIRATVNSDGLVTALSEGLVNISASVKDVSTSFEILITRNNVVNLSFIDLPDELTVSKYADLIVDVEFETGITLVNPDGIDFSVDDNTAATIIGKKILGIKQKNVKVTATFKEQKTENYIFINSVELNEVPGFLSTPASNSIYEIPVIIIRYLPTSDGINLDVKKCPGYYSLDEISLENLKQTIDDYDLKIKYSLEEGSRFRGYKNNNSLPSIGYKVVKYITVYEHTPKGMLMGYQSGQPTYLPDFHSIFQRFNIEEGINNYGVKEIWFWQSHFDADFPSYNPQIHNSDDFRFLIESNMSSPLTGDISNSSQITSDLPVYNHTYTVYGQNFRRTQAEAVHNRGHQYERLFTYAELGNNGSMGNSPLFWQKFVGTNPDGNSITGRCGWTHMPPNTTQHYDYLNTTQVLSDIEDWKPDNSGEKKQVNVDTWGNLSYSWPGIQSFNQRIETQWYIYWMQNTPGYQNDIPYLNDKKISNWWKFVADWDNAIATGQTLYE